MRLIIVALLMFTSSAALAAKVSCGGKMTKVMAGHYACEGYIAFKTVQSPSKWMCSKSKDADSAILAGFMADRTTTVLVESGNDTISTCADLTSYSKIDYIMLDK